jgi:hypothetical protein
VDWPCYPVPRARARNGRCRPKSANSGEKRVAEISVVCRIRESRTIHAASSEKSTVSGVTQSGSAQTFPNQLRHTSRHRPAIDPLGCRWVVVVTLSRARSAGGGCETRDACDSESVAARSRNPLVDSERRRVVEPSSTAWPALTSESRGHGRARSRWALPIPRSPSHRNLLGGKPPKRPMRLGAASHGTALPVPSFRLRRHDAAIRRNEARRPA